MNNKISRKPKKVRKMTVLTMALIATMVEFNLSNVTNAEDYQISNWSDMSGYNLNGKTGILQNDITATSGLTSYIGSNTSLDMNGKTIYGSSSFDDNLFYIDAAGKTFNITGGGAIKDAISSSDGAVMFLSHGKIPTLSINFENNTSKVRGGAIANFGSIDNLTGNFTGNSAESGWNAEGGAIYNQTNYGYAIGNISSTFTSNYASTTGDGATAQGGAISNSHWGAGAGISGTISSDFITNYANATGNSATARGGAIYNDHPTVMNISGAHFTGNYTTGATAQGGAIFNGSYTNGGILNISDTAFEWNGYSNYNGTSATTAATKEGGAIYNAANSTINFTGTNTFSNNAILVNSVATANDIYNAGTINVNSGSTSLNSGIVQKGGHIYIKNGSNLSVAKGEFNNTSSTANGAAIYNAGGTNDTPVSISNSSFNYNKRTGNAEGGGGAIYNSGYINISDSSFTGNEMQKDYKAGNAGGGAIYNSGHLSITGTNTFTNNVSKMYGGAICNYGGTIDTIDADFTGNSAVRSYLTALGGAIYNNSTINSISGNFTSNYAKGPKAQGGAISVGAKSISGSFTENRVISTSTKSSGRNAFGGAIINQTANSIINADFIKNYAQGYYAYGGALYNAVTSSIEGDFNGNYTTGNYAKGGAIYNTSSITINDSNFNWNGFSNYNGTSASSVATKEGGTIYNAGTINFTGTNTFSHNAAITGGAIYNLGTINGINDSTFDSNYVSTSGYAMGGAIYTDGTSKITNGITNSTFTGNHADGNQASGGVICINGQGSALKVGIIDNVTFTNNYTKSAKSASQGGAIWTSGQITNGITNSTFTGNYVKSTNGGTSQGGAILNTVWVNPVELLISDTTFTGNGYENYGLSNQTAVTKQGGAIYNNTGATMSLIDTTFSNNATTVDGGAIYNLGTINFAGTNTFTGNIASGIANDIYNAGTINFNTSTILPDGISGTGTTIIAEGKTLTLSNTATTLNQSNLTVSQNAILNSSATKMKITNQMANSGTFNLNNGTATIEKMIQDAGRTVVADGTDLTIKVGEISNSTGYSAGSAIYNDGTLAIGESVDNKVIFKDNSSTSNAGALYIDANGTLASMYADFTENTSSDGGAIFAAYQAQMGDIYGTYKENYAKSSSNEANGGAITVCTDINVGGIVADFTGNYAYTDSASGNAQGGAINNYNAIISSIKGDFTGNYAKSDSTSSSYGAKGGAINNRYRAYDNKYGTINKIYDSNFVGNYAIAENGAAQGGAIYNDGIISAIDNTTFSWNGYENYNADADGDIKATNVVTKQGGAIYNNQRTISLTNTKFSNNATTEYGGAIYNKSGSTISLTNTDFSNNATTLRGGAIYSDGIIASVADAKFSGNYTLADSGYAIGGAIYAGNNSKITDGITNTIFKGNHADGNQASGGAICLNGKGSALKVGIIDNATFENNYTKSAANTSQGGAIWTSGQITSGITNSTFVGNYAKSTNGGLSQGGAIFNTKWETAVELAISDTTFGWNGYDNYDADTNDNIKATNVVTQCGGAIYNKSESIMSLANTTFTNNAATENGGAIYNAGSLTLAGENVFTGNEANLGGAIYNHSGANIKTITGSFDKNVADTDTGVASGGAIYNYEGTIGDTTTLPVSGGIGSDTSRVTFSNNSAKSESASGGAIHTQNGTITNIYADFKGNSATATSGSASGGAIYNIGTTINTLTGIFDGNSATSTSGTAWGGAICNIGTTFTINNSTFENNKAEGVIALGGAIYNTGSLSFTGTNTFENNTVNGIANDIYNTGNLTITGNTTMDGGIIGTGNINLGDGTADTTLKLGSNATLNQETLNYNNATLDSTNNTINNYTVNTLGGSNNAYFKLDFDGSAVDEKAIDRLTITNVDTLSSPTVEVKAINIVKDATSDKTLTWLEGNDLSTLIDNTSTVSATSVHKYIFTKLANGKLHLGLGDGVTLPEAVHDSTCNMIEAYSITDAAMTYNLNDNLDDLNKAGRTLTVFGNNHIIDALNNYSGVNISTGQTLTFDNATWQNFVKTGNSGVVNNAGTFNLTGENIFSNNNATGNGGAIYNTGTLNIDGTQTFSNNIAGNTANDIYNAGNININSGTTTLKSGLVQNGGHTSVAENATFNLANGTFDNASATEDILNNGTLNLTGTNSMTKGITGTGSTIIGNGNATNADILTLVDTASLTQKDLTVVNNATLSVNATKLAITNAIQNAGTINLNGGTLSSAIQGENGTLNMSDVVNTAEISQKDITISGSSFANNASITSTNNFVANTTIAGTGDLTIKYGTFNASVEQNSITVKGTLTQQGTTTDLYTIGESAVVNITNNSSINTEKLVNNGTINLNGSGIFSGSYIQATAQDKAIEGTINSISGLNAINVAGATSGTSSNDIKSVINMVDGGSLRLEKGNILSDAKITIDQDSTLILQGGFTVLNNNDTWNGVVALQGGSLVFDNIDTKDTSAQLNAQTGNLTIQNGTLSMNNSGDSIAKAVITTIAQGGSLKLDNDNATVNLNGDTNADTWNGDINVVNGTLNISDDLTKTGALIQTGGATNITGNFALDNENDLISGGILTVGDGSGAVNENILTVLEDTIVIGVNNAKLVLNSDATLNIVKGTTVITNVDEWNGAISSTGGTVLIANREDETDTTKAYNQTGGELYLYYTNLDLKNGSAITNATINLDPSTLTFNNGVDNSATIITADSTINVLGNNTTLTTLIDTNITGGSITVGDDTSYTTNPTLIFNQGTMTGGTLTVKKGILNSSGDAIQVAVTNNGEYNLTNGTISQAITGNDGTLNILGPNTTSNIAEITQKIVTVDGGATFTNNGTVSTTLTNNGTINGDGNLILTGDSSNALDKEITQNAITINSGKTFANNGTVNADSFTNNGTFNITDGTATINSINQNNGNTAIASGATLSIANGTFTNSTNDIANNGILNISGNTVLDGGIAGNGTTSITNSTFRLASAATLEQETLSLNNVIFDSVNNTANNYEINTLGGSNNAYFKLDFDGSTDSIDKITLAALDTGTPIVQVSAINIAKDSETIGTIYLSWLDGPTSGLIDNTGTVSATTEHVYDFEKNGAGKLKITLTGGITLPQAIHEAAYNRVESYSINNTEPTYNLNDNLGDLNKDGRNLTIFANNHTINALNTYSGVNTVDGQTITIDKAIMQNFVKTGNGAVVNNFGTLNLTGGNTFANNTTSGNGGVIYNATSGILNFEGDNTFLNNIANNSPNDIYNAGQLNINSGTTTLSSGIIQDGGQTIVANGAQLNITNGVFKNSTNDIENNGILNIIGTNSIASGITGVGTTTIGNGVNPTILSLGAGATFEQEVVNLNYGSLNTVNGAINDLNFNTLGLTGNNTIYVDVDLANTTIDTLNATAVSGSGLIHVAGLNILSNATTDLTTINFTSTPDLMGRIDYTGSSSIYTPIYNYGVSYNNTNGNFNFAKTGFNPSVLASSVGAQVGAYLTQINNYEQAFGNMDMRMNMTQAERTAWKLANKYASTETQGLSYAPNNIAQQNRDVLFRPYATFEKVGLNAGPTVENIAYGSLFGGDSDLKELSHGWDFVWGAYAGYNGSHQNYDGVSIYQNGGTLGLNAAWYKGNFFTGLTANVGASVAEASTMYGNENFTMLMTGIASKTGYNLELANGKFIIQPSFLMSYTFVNTFDYTSASGVRINSDPLNAIQIVPGLKFIGNLPNGWQPYLGVQMVWNIMDKTHFFANDVTLPQMSVDPYVQYGVGVQKRWGKVFTGYLQAMIRNGGRNGVALSAGFSWALGKDPSKGKLKQSNASKLELKKADINLSSMK